MVTVDYISDIHLLMTMNPYKAGRPHKIRKWIDRNLWTEDGKRGDWLVVAGDLAEYNSVSYNFLKECSKIWKEVFFVFGNHDLWLSNRQMNTLNYNSDNKKEDLKEMVKEIKNVHVLDNSVVEISGKKIAGSMNWYYLPTEKDIMWWSEWSNDSRRIFPYGFQNSNERSLVDKKFLWDLEGDYDLLITHVPPVHFEECHKRPNRAYYSPVEFKNNTNIKYWISGHQHTVSSAEYKGKIQLLANCFGYPFEKRLSKYLKQIEI